MLIQINFKSGKPVYLQIVDLKAAAASGALQPGEALPYIRPLAEELRLNRNTIAKAYSELESMGVIETVPGKGCFLKENNSPLRKEIRRRMLIEEIDQAIVQAHHLQVPGDEFLNSCTNASRRWKRSGAPMKKVGRIETMNRSAPAIGIENLSYSYGRAEAIRDLDLTVQPGQCYGLFGRNGAGKTTTMKCLLNLLRPQAGQVRVFGLDPAVDEVQVKRKLAYVPDQVAFYPWMSVRETLDYFASFRQHWNRNTERDLLDRFRLDETQRTSGLSKGQRTQVALIAAVSPKRICWSSMNPLPASTRSSAGNSLRP